MGKPRLIMACVRYMQTRISKYLSSQYYLFTILGTVVDLEPLHNHVHATSTNINNTGLNSNQDQIENAVIKQELMASKEEIADLKAKIYVSDKEKTGNVIYISVWKSQKWKKLLALKSWTKKSTFLAQWVKQTLQIYMVILSKERIKWFFINERITKECVLKSALFAKGAKGNVNIFWPNQWRGCKSY